MMPFPFSTWLVQRALPFLAAVLCASSAAAQAAGDLHLFRLRDGRTVWGSIETHDEGSFAVRRLRGGRVELPWTLLDPQQEQELRLVLGYLDEGQEEVTLDADRLVLVDGTELVGRIVQRTPEHVWLKRASGVVPVAVERVATKVPVRAPALDLFTREELYEERSAELAGRLVAAGARGAEAHLELAQYAESLFDFANAAKHYRLVRELDPDHRPELVSEALPRAEAKAERQEQVDLLREADQWRGRGLYERSWAILNAFPERFPGSPLMEDWNRMRRRVERTQERELRERVIDRWFHWSAKYAREAAREIESLEAAQSWAEDRMSEKVLAAVHADALRIAPEVQPEEVRAMWDAREGGRYRQASYGLGTWLLGEERALAVPEEEQEAEPAEQGSQADARQRLEARIKRYLENQEVLRKNRARQGSAEDPEVFWKSMKISARAQWLLAYHVEASGDFRVDRIRFANCRECGGTGVRRIVYTGGAVSGQSASSGAIPCPTCHTIGRVRRVRYR